MILIWTVVTEVGLALYMRDSLVLILIQLSCNIQVVLGKQTQSKGVDISLHLTHIFISP